MRATVLMRGLIAALALAGLTGSAVAAEAGAGLSFDRAPFVDAPVPLLLADAQNTKLVIQDAGLELLRAIGDTRLSLVVTAGPARSGKSFLLNNLVGVPHDSGFGVGHTPKVRMVPCRRCCSLHGLRSAVW